MVDKWKYTFLYSLVMLIPFDLLAALGMDLYLPAINNIRYSFDVSHEMIQLTLTLYMATLGLGQLIFGPLSDAIGRRPVIVVGAFVYAFSSFIMSMSHSFSIFLSFRILQSLAGAAVLVAAFATVRDVFSKKETGVVIYAIMGSILAFVPAFAPFLGSIIEYIWHWEGIFFFLGIFATIAGVHALLKWPETRPHYTHPFKFKRFFTIIKSRTFMGYTLAYATAIGTFFVYFSISPSLLIDELGLNKIEFSLWFGSVAVVMIITAHFVKRLVSRWGIRGTAFIGLTGLMISGVILFGVELFFGLSLFGFMLPMYLIGINISLICSVTASGALEAFSSSAGLATALYYAIESLFLSALASLLIAFTPPGTSAIITIYIFISAILAIFFITSGAKYIAK